MSGLEWQVQRAANQGLVVPAVPPRKVFISYSEGHPQTPGREPRFPALSCLVGVNSDLGSSFEGLSMSGLEWQVQRAANQGLVAPAVPPRKVFISYSQGHPQTPGGEPRFPALSCLVGVNSDLGSSFEGLSMSGLEWQVQRAANQGLVAPAVPPRKVFISYSQGHPQTPGGEPRFPALSCLVGVNSDLGSSFEGLRMSGLEWQVQREANQGLVVPAVRPRKVFISYSEGHPQTPGSHHPGSLHLPGWRSCG